MNHVQTCLLILTFTLQSTVLAADPAQTSKVCDGCHGPQGVSTDKDVPTIAGQSPEFLAGALDSFQAWGRPCRKSAYRHGDTSRPATTMCEIAAGLSGDDIQALADYYGQQTFVAAEQDFDAARATAGEALYPQCESCHPQGGKVSGRGPILAGQWMPYLKTAARQSLTGEHLVPPLMEKGLSEFSDEELDAVMNFFASQRD